MKKTKKRGRPVGSKNKPVFHCEDAARIIAKSYIATHGINAAEALAIKILEKIRADKARLNEKYKT